MATYTELRQLAAEIATKRSIYEAAERQVEHQRNQAAAVLNTAKRALLQAINEGKNPTQTVSMQDIGAVATFILNQLPPDPASATETLKRLPVIDDLVISEAMAPLDQDTSEPTPPAEAHASY